MSTKRTKQMKRKSRKPRRESVGKEFAEDVQSSLMKLPITPFLLSTTVTTGVIASNTQLDPATLVKNFTTRFQGTFDEYKVIGGVLKARPLTTSTGVTKFWFSRDVAPTTATEAQERPGKLISNSQANSKAFVNHRFRNHDYQRLEWITVGAQENSVLGWNVYTDVANFGAPATVVPLWFIEGELHVRFRGIGSA